MAATQIKALLWADAKNIRRDFFMMFMLVYPWVFALLGRYLVPLADASFAVDLRPYYPLFVCFLSVLAPLLLGQVIGFKLLDEKDEGTMTAVLVTPLPLSVFVLYRLLFVIGGSVFIVFATTMVTGLTSQSLGELFLISIAASLLAPAYAFYLAAFAGNKVEGFALVKASSLFLVAPVAAWFTDEPWQFLFGLSPTYWPAKAFWAAAAGESSWFYILVAAVYSALVVWLLYRVFSRRVLGR